MAAAGGGKATRRTQLEVEVEEEEQGVVAAPAPARSRGRGGRSSATARAEAEPEQEEPEGGAESDEEGSQQQGSMLGSILRSAHKALSRGRRGEAEEEGGEHLGELSRWRRGLPLGCRPVAPALELFQTAGPAAVS